MQEPTKLCDGLRALNSFRFKRFAIEQSKSAMKIGFDGVLLGAWANVTRCRNILDVGTGTGLIALMIAQRTEARPRSEIDRQQPAEAPRIDAVEIDLAAFEEARGNIRRSPWSDRIRCHHESIQQFVSSASNRRFDMIVCNPPYFGKAAQDVFGKSGFSRRIARHAEFLTITELFQYAPAFGAWRICLIVPIDEQSQCLEAAANVGMSCRRLTVVRHSLCKPVKRVLLEFECGVFPTCADELTIETEHRHQYTAEFQALTSAFYLKL